jgi:hypothetical protein
VPYFIKGGPPVGLRVPLGPYYGTGQQVFGQRLYGTPTRGLGAFWIPLFAATAGAVALYETYSEEEIEDQWRPSNTFNDKALRVNAQWEGINRAISQCPGAWNTAGVREPFREAWLTGWAPWYDEEGDRFTDASAGTVKQLRDYLVEANSWAVRVGELIQANCPDQYVNYAYRQLNDVGLDPASGTVTDQQRDRLEEARAKAQIQKTQAQGQAPEFERWGKILGGVGWVLVGAITLGTVAFGYRVYQDARKK